MEINSASKKHGFVFKATVADTFWDELPKASQDYLKAYGLRQALSDSIASAKTESEAKGLFDKRVDKLKAGTMSIREVGPRDPFEEECKRLAAVRVDNALKAKGLKKPDNYKALVEQVRSKHAAVIEAEATANLAKAQELTVDLDDLFDEEEIEQAPEEQADE